MSLRDLVSHWFKNRKVEHYEELGKVIGLLVENYKQKLVLLSDFQERKIGENDFRTKFLDLLKVETSLEALGETLAKKEKTEQEKQIDIEMQRLRQILKEQEALVQRIDFIFLREKVREEGDLLAMEQKEVKNLENNIFKETISESELKNLSKLQDYGMNIDIQKDLAMLLARNWDLTQKLISILNKAKVNVVHRCMINYLPALQRVGLLSSKDDLAVLIELADKCSPYEFGYVCEYGFSSIAAEKGLINSKNDFRDVWFILIEFINKCNPSFLTNFFLTGLPAIVDMGIVRSKDDLRSIGLLLIELISKLKWDYKQLFLGGLHHFNYLIKSRNDLEHVGLFLIELISKLTYSDIVELFERDGFSNIKIYVKRVDDLPKIYSILPQILIKLNKSSYKHRLYRGQDAEFFRLGANVVRRNFDKTGSKTILLGGKLVGKAIIRIVSEPAFLAWKKAFEAKDVWKKAGFDYVPVEPILTKKEELRAYQTKKGNYYRVYTKVLGISLGVFIDKTSDEELITHLKLIKEKIIDVLTKELNIEHGHMHDNNFCLDIEDYKIRLYLIDFDQAVSPI